MKPLYAIALASLAAASPASATTIFLGDYNVYATGDAYISGGSYGDIASGSFTNANGSGGGNFTSQTASSTGLTQTAHDLSASYAGMASTGTATTAPYQPGNMTLTGSTSGINVFTIDGNDWSQLYSLTFAGLGEGAIINISGTNLGNYVGFNYGGLAAENVLFNFYEANSLSFGGMTFNGSVLAPDAFVTIQGGSVAGSVIADSFHSEGAMIGGAAFGGLLTNATAAIPEPATWAMMILGFGAVGFALRRRGRKARRDAVVPAQRIAA